MLASLDPPWRCVKRKCVNTNVGNGSKGGGGGRRRKGDFAQSIKKLAAIDPT
jgi:hypothetical protein